MIFILILLYSLGLYRLRLMLPAIIVHAFIIVSSAISFGRIPLIGMRETLGFLALSLGTSALIAGWNNRTRIFSGLVIPLIVLLLIGSLSSAPAGHGLPPVLKTLWFELHVILSFVSYALFALAAVFGIIALRTSDGDAERAQYRSVLLGYVLFSTAMIFGGIWAYLAWGTYWLWTPKELWTTIIWFFYSLYLHARLVQGWSGRKVVWMGIIGFIIVMFTYAGVGLLMKSSHEF